MNVSTFYALFSATCFTLIGLWWNVIPGHTGWKRDPALRRVVGGVYVAFLLPGLMGLFAQVGGTKQPEIWRAAFISFAAVGCVYTLLLLGRARHDHFVTWQQACAALLYALIAVVGAFPELVRRTGLAPIQVEAVMLILLIVLGHALVWRFMTAETPTAQDAATG